jgi:hypothetical protein
MNIKEYRYDMKGMSGRKSLMMKGSNARVIQENKRRLQNRYEQRDTRLGLQYVTI